MGNSSSHQGRVGVGDGGLRQCAVDGGAPGECREKWAPMLEFRPAGEARVARETSGAGEAPPDLPSYEAGGAGL